MFDQFMRSVINVSFPALISEEKQLKQWIRGSWHHGKQQKKAEDREEGYQHSDDGKVN